MAITCGPNVGGVALDQQPGRPPAGADQGGHPDRQPDVVRPFVRQAEEDGRQRAGRYPRAGQAPQGPRLYQAAPQVHQEQQGVQEQQFPQAQPVPQDQPQVQQVQPQVPQDQPQVPQEQDVQPIPPAPGPGSSLIPTPMPAPRAVARQIRPENRATIPAQRPMSDLTTTMPILAVPADDGDGRNAPPGEYGHFHDEDDNGRHRGTGRSPRAVKAAAVLIGVIAAGAAVAGTFTGGSGKSASPQAAGTTGSEPAATSQAAAAAASSSQAAPTSAASSPSPTPTPTPTHSTKSPSPKPSTPAGAGPTVPAMAPRPASSAPTTAASSVTSTASSPATTPPPTTPSSSPSPAFKPLQYGDSGPAVSKLQSDLMAAGYAYVLEAYGYHDGQYDGATWQAVTKFQQNHRGTAQADGYGVYGVATNTALQAALHGAGG